MSPLVGVLRVGLPGLLFLATVFSVAELHARIEGEAAIGRPFGVGRITFSGGDVGSIDDRLCRLEEKNGRIFYPAAMPGMLGRLLTQILGNPTQGAAESVTIHFLFRGDEPLELSLYSPAKSEVTLTPRNENRRVYDRLRDGWWRDYQALAKQQITRGDHPPLIQNYLQAMLSQRLGLTWRDEMLEERRENRNPNASSTNESLELLLGLEDLRLRTLRDSMLGRSDYTARATEPLPAGMAWPPAALPTIEGEVPVEAIAAHVPPEYFYIRFGTFRNYLWLSDLLKDYGGDLGSMVTMRSYAAPLNKRIQDQLGLEQNALAKVLGPTVINDVALIGQDLYLVDGAAMGILFEAKQPEVLDDDIQKQRRRAIERDKERGSKLETIKISGRDVSFASTPDNHLRSYYVFDGKYHLVTTSRTMVERFLAVSGGAGSLAQSPEFIHARTILPLLRDDTIFVYFSKSFFEGLLTPQYQIELRRRMQATTDLDLLRFARLAARGEGLEVEQVETLVQAGFLPPSFGRHPDGSGPVIAGEEFLDTHRGARGHFLPIADMPIDLVTAAEAARYRNQATAYLNEWKVMDPLMVGIKRFALPKTDPTQPTIERVTIDGNITPLNEAKYGQLMSMLGPPTTQMITRSADDIVSAQAMVKGMNLLGNIPPHHLFLGMQDLTPVLENRRTGLFGTLQMLRSTPGYLGSWPKAGYLDALPLGQLLSSRPDANGFSQLPLGLWRREGGGFSVLSFDANVLAKVTPELRVVEAEVPAQIRLHIGDLSTAKVAPLINQMYYDRALSASSGNVRLLHMLNQQLHVPIEDCETVAEDLLNAQLKCPLGGEYKLLEEVGAGLYWRSTVWPARYDLAPADYRAPLLDWFRGLDGHLTKEQGRLIAHIEVDLARKPEEPTATPEFKLPIFDLFGGQKAFKTKPKDPNAAELPPPLPPVKDVPVPPKGKEF
ncbi:hypothetical protein ETAA8_08020 [Anatilimnocola aggregata]|uniref:Uncharacterized protein n=1 Tax=Anatilimnocola aggregata TaxID=2528021 RepID=A0A517Y6H3_9BACT|nr:hypothetical protein [Anatilimnocola aggregata]QDU25732.1 hypothetical protein ETAA8_08020 [Anatilimnocola aggregata]